MLMFPFLQVLFLFLKKVFICFLEMKKISYFYLLKLIGTSEDKLNDKGKLTKEIYPLGSEEDDNSPHKKYNLNIEIKNV